MTAPDMLGAVSLFLKLHEKKETKANGDNALYMPDKTNSEG